MIVENFNSTVDSFEEEEGESLAEQTKIESNSFIELSLMAKNLHNSGKELINLLKFLEVTKIFYITSYQPFSVTN